MMPEVWTTSRLGDALGAVAWGGPERPVRHVSRDSRDVGEGSAFVAIAGGRVDGHDLLGSLPDDVVLVLERPGAPAGRAWILVDDTRRALGEIAALIYGRPASSVPVVGVTGTNGKTTVTTLMYQAIGATGGVAGRIGTTGIDVGGRAIPSKLTTPEAHVLHAMFAEMRDARAELVAMEVSSIGLVQQRVAGIPFHVAVFTNLSHDHLDFHGTYEAYAEAKSRLFRLGLRAEGGAPRALLFGDDPAWASMAPPADRLLYGEGAHNDLRITDVDASAHGMVVDLRHPWGAHTIATPMVGRHNAHNLVAAFGAGVLAGIDPDRMARGLAMASGAPGRLERVVDPAGRMVLVDYAHTPDGIDTALRAVRPLTEGRVVLVFGCGGDRDTAKRAPMGRAAMAADVVVLTSDNPRSEEPSAILRDVQVGMVDRRDGQRVIVEVDRARAIAQALEVARPGDVVLIAGKGHETTQEIAGVLHPFDDRLVAADWLERHR
jgi:UDP-N-acetylmuramoyl-L-alanyl-D-glutamate--2,6-diaminopimelate ligase